MAAHPPAKRTRLCADSPVYHPTAHYVSNDEVLSRSGHAVAALDGMLYLFGGVRDEYRAAEIYEHGKTVVGKVISPEYLNDLNAIPVASLRDSRKEWVRLTPHGDVCPEPTFGHSLSACRGALYAFGGKLADGTVTNHLHIYSVERNEWVRCAPDMAGGWPAPRWGACAVVVGEEYILYFGGQVNDVPTDELWRFDLQSHTMTLLDTHGPGPVPRHHPSCCLYGHSLYIFGGRIGNCTGELWELSLETMAWKMLTPVGLEHEAIVIETERENFTVHVDPLPRTMHTACMMGSHMVVFGGTSAIDPVAVECPRVEVTKNDLLTLDLSHVGRHDFQWKREQYEVTAAIRQTPLYKQALEAQPKVSEAAELLRYHFVVVRGAPFVLASQPTEAQLFRARLLHPRPFAMRVFGPNKALHRSLLKPLPADHFVGPMRRSMHAAIGLSDKEMLILGGRDRFGALADAYLIQLAKSLVELVTAEIATRFPFRDSMGYLPKVLEERIQHEWAHSAYVQRTSPPRRDPRIPREDEHMDM